MATEAQLAALARGREARKGKSAATPAAPPRPAPSAVEAVKASVRWTVAAWAALAAVVAAGLTVLRTPQLTPGGDLVPWTGGSGWRVRPGQYIDPAAAASLAVVGENLVGCATAPLTLDVSREGGGLYPPHVSHQTGLDVDIRMSDISSECRTALQLALKAAGWRTWYDGPDAMSPTAGGRHKTHLHARFNKEKS